MRRLLCTPVGLCLMAAGCVAVPTLPDAGVDAPVRHVRAEGRFLFTTDTPLDDDEPAVAATTALARRLEERLGLPTCDVPIRVVLFDSRQQFDGFLARNYPDLPPRRAFFVRQPADDGEAERNLVYAVRSPRLVEDLRHELTHAILHTAGARMPLWLDEGLAVHFEADDGWHADHAERLRQRIADGWRPDRLRLERMTDLHEMAADDYREAWLWTWAVLHGPPPLAGQLRRSLTGDERIVDWPSADEVVAHLAQ